MTSYLPSVNRHSASGLVTPRERVRGMLGPPGPPLRYSALSEHSPLTCDKVQPGGHAMTERLMQVREAARDLGVHENTIRRWVEAGVIRAVRLPSGVRRFRPEDVDRLRKQMYDDFADASLAAEASTPPPRSRATAAAGKPGRARQSRGRGATVPKP